jgi:hypothetical protein
VAPVTKTIMGVPPRIGVGRVQGSGVGGSSQPMSSMGQGLGVPVPFGARVPPLGVNPSDAQKTLSEKEMIPDRLQGRRPGT